MGAGSRTGLRPIFFSFYRACSIRASLDVIVSEIAFIAIALAHITRVGSIALDLSLATRPTSSSSSLTQHLLTFCGVEMTTPKLRCPGIFSDLTLWLGICKKTGDGPRGPGGGRSWPPGRSRLYFFGFSSPSMLQMAPDNMECSAGKWARFRALEIGPRCAVGACFEIWY